MGFVPYEIPDMFGDVKNRIGVGVMPKKDSSGMFGGDESNEIVYIPYTTALHNFVRRPRWLEIMATPIKPELQSQAMDQVIELLRIRRKVKPSEDNNFAVFTQDTISDLYNQRQLY